MTWIPITEDCLPPKAGTVMLASDREVMGQYSGRRVDHGEVLWFINDSYYDGDDEPKYWILLPPLPTL